eukprot:CAMPEP_0184325946 /NCGR_PEP_ID=MMETSP1049-20130417/142302_1 /TAXON_ID=77928 /ORGANISM="Proteomonas sulcata, Strain CCMP704" /LENGTH=307 /DNA_ID=CAMNT_0026648113 /DNA_START=1523 /DNA_END=2446 /DNA_ORIENTATION=-
MGRDCFDMEHTFQLKSDVENGLKAEDPFKKFCNTFESITKGENNQSLGNGAVFGLREHHTLNGQPAQNPFSDVGNAFDIMTRHQHDDQTGSESGAECFTDEDKQRLLEDLGEGPIHNSEFVPFMCSMERLDPGSFEAGDVERSRTRSSAPPGLTAATSGDVEVDDLAERTAAIQLSIPRLLTKTCIAVRQDERLLNCERWTSRVQWYKVRPDTKVGLLTAGVYGNEFKARFWTMTRAKQIRPYMEQEDIALANEPIASLDSSSEHSDQDDEVLGVWVIRDPKGAVCCQVAVMREDFEYRDLGIDKVA